jgi:GntR family transcriptional regulator, transcriptional repressor for pyruvate dehydrogenase complex
LLSKDIEKQIEDAIRLKKLVPGEKLPSEQEMCTLFGVSRTAVREALRMLHAKGLISIQKGKGMHVRQFSEETVTNPMHLYLELHLENDYVLDLVQARQILEPPIAALAARNRSEKDLVQMKEHLEKFRAHDGSFDELSKLDALFHVDIARASGNAFLPLLLDPIHRLLPKIKSGVYTSVKDAKESAVKWHQQIYQAIADGNPEKAEESMRKHLKVAQQHAEIMLKKKKAVV